MRKLVASVFYDDRARQIYENLAMKMKWNLQISQATRIMSLCQLKRITVATVTPNKIHLCFLKFLFFFR